MLQDRVAIVTGGASGIGRAIAQLFSQQGATVLVADLNAEGAEAVADALRQGGGTASALGVDLTQRSEAERLATAAVTDYGKIDILVYSAGVGLQKDFLETSEEDWDRVMAVNLRGNFLCAQAVARQMVKTRYGRIVHLASVAGERGGTGRAAYGASKGGVIALTRVMAVELAPYNITVNALAPGAIETELVKKMHTAGTRKAYVATLANQRYGTPEEVADSALFLVREEARYVTGEIVHVDGGFTAGGVMIRDGQ